MNESPACNSPPLGPWLASLDQVLSLGTVSQLEQWLRTHIVVTAGAPNSTAAATLNSSDAPIPPVAHSSQHCRVDTLIKTVIKHGCPTRLAVCVDLVQCDTSFLSSAAMAHWVHYASMCNQLEMAIHMQQRLLHWPTLPPRSKPVLLNVNAVNGSTGTERTRPHWHTLSSVNSTTQHQRQIDRKPSAMWSLANHLLHTSEFI
ncbi:hypothetical protein H310_10707 [Aphanomyces invadans]|uniref:Uncharacterized protein n=1 Tax=Aphanomyces invadans TaxID=157072 RepID=A0A024TQZ9_9STRA|nr:hypothetical protein H310_10707 [Aphanomyces invadans]ETV96061.1 hypothetical protein H310_10707 [Aphanomyces invadans]|eukprot:XP_008875372.1 hypothetical protein H310_10707 [Aphanomyces invadans]